MTVSSIPNTAGNHPHGAREGEPPLVEYSKGHAGLRSCSSRECGVSKDRSWSRLRGSGSQVN